MTFQEKLRYRKLKEQKLRRHKDLLLEAVRNHIFPVLIKQGFSITPRREGQPADRKDRDTFPLGFLQRARPDGGVDLVEIQFMTYQRAAFRINACPVPKDGMMTLGGHRTVEELEAGGLHDHFEMYEFPRWWIWFSLRLWRFRTPVKSTYDKLAQRVAGYLPEIELALREGKLGPHMRKIVTS